MQFQLLGKLYPIDDDAFWAWVDKWRETQRVPDNAPIGIRIDVPGQESFIALTDLGQHLMIEFLTSRGELDRNVLLEGAEIYNARKHRDLICNS